jgi:hypothetical protein
MYFHIKFVDGCAIAEAVSRWLPTAVVRVQSRVWSSGICGAKSGVGPGFLRMLRFPLPFIPPNSPSSQSPGAGTIGQASKWPKCRVDQVWTPPPTMQIKKRKICWFPRNTFHSFYDEFNYVMILVILGLVNNKYKIRIMLFCLREVKDRTSFDIAIYPTRFCLQGHLHINII